MLKYGNFCRAKCGSRAMSLAKKWKICVASWAFYPALATIVINFISTSTIFTSIVITDIPVSPCNTFIILVCMCLLSYSSVLSQVIPNNHIVPLSKSKSLPTTSVSQRQPWLISCDSQLSFSFQFRSHQVRFGMMNAMAVITSSLMGTTIIVILRMMMRLMLMAMRMKS